MAPYSGSDTSAAGMLNASTWPGRSASEGNDRRNVTTKREHHEALASAAAGRPPRERVACCVLPVTSMHPFDLACGDFADQHLVQTRRHLRLTLRQRNAPAHDFGKPLRQQRFLLRLGVTVRMHRLVSL